MRTILRTLIWVLVSTAILIGLEMAINISKGYQIHGNDIITDYGIHLLSLIGINISLAVSLNLINGYTGQFSLGHAGFMAIGAYTSAVITKTLLANPSQHSALSSGVIFIIALLAGAATSAVAGLLVGIPSLRLKGDYLAIVTLGFGEIIRLTIENIDAVGGPRGYNFIPKFESLVWVYLFVIITIIIVHNIVRSSFGRALIAIRENEIAAEAMGINISSYKVIAFTISAALAGVAGGLFAHQEGQIAPTTFNFLKSVEIIIMIVFGGMGSITGAVFGAIVLTLMPEWLRQLKDLRMPIYSLLLIVIMIVRPQGILGHREISLRRILRIFGRAQVEDISQLQSPAVALAEEVKKS